MAGSPPHTWRIQLRLFLLPAYNGNTSTYVENTTKTLSFARIQWDHLHIRGEYYQTSSYFLWTLGSPPHTWRIPTTWTVLLTAYRITSTYVENTETGGRNNALARDHLHIRGEYPIFSSPLAVRLRITSTYVENTKPGREPVWKIKDHLHIRGEYVL